MFQFCIYTENACVVAEHCRDLIEGGKDKDRELSESASAEVFSIPGPVFTDVNYCNDQQGDPAHSVWIQARTRYHLRGREKGQIDVCSGRKEKSGWKCREQEKGNKLKMNKEGRGGQRK